METNDYWIYDSRAPLAGGSMQPGRSRMIGVMASKPFHHAGLNTLCVDVHRETVSLRTETYGNYFPVESSEEEIRRATAQIVSDLNLAIARLIVHRDRLVTDEGTTCLAL